MLSTEKAELQRGKQEVERQLAALQQRMQVGWARLGAALAWHFAVGVARMRLGRLGGLLLLHMLRLHTAQHTPPLQVRETEVAAQLAAKEEEARRAAQQAAAAAAAAAAAPAARAPLAPAAAPVHQDADMGVPDGDEFEDAENLPNINKMTIAQVLHPGQRSGGASTYLAAVPCLALTHARCVACGIAVSSRACLSSLPADEGLADGAWPRGRRLGAGAGASTGQRTGSTTGCVSAWICTLPPTASHQQCLTNSVSAPAQHPLRQPSVSPHAVLVPQKKGKKSDFEQLMRRVTGQ